MPVGSSFQTDDAPEEHGQRAVDPPDARYVEQYEAGDQPDRRVRVGLEMPASGYERDRVVAPPGPDAVKAQQVVYRSRRRYDRDARVELLDLRGYEQPADAFVDDSRSGQQDQQAFDRGRDQLDLAVSERMVAIGGSGGSVQAVKADQARRYVDDTLHRIGQHTDRIGQEIGGELACHQHDRAQYDASLHPLLDLFFFPDFHRTLIP